MYKFKEKIATLSSNRGRYVLFCISILFAFIAMYLLNRLYPLLAEDWDYSYIWTMGKYSPYRVSGIMDIVGSQYTHYMMWGGRSITHGIVQFLLMLGTTFSDILSSLAFVLFILSVYRIINNRNQMNIYVLLLLILSLWFLLPDFMTTTVWLTYSVNYLWSTLIILAFIYHYYNYFRSGKSSDGFFKSVFLFLAGIVSGWTNENMSIATVSFLILLLILLKYNKQEIPHWALWGLAGAIIGCGILLAAPGNYLRLQYSYIGYWKRLFFMSQHYIHYLLIPSVVYISLFFVFKKKSESRDKNKILLSSLLFFIASHVGFGVMIGSSEFPTRVLFGVITFLIIGIGILFSNLDIQYPKIKIVSCILIILMFVLFCFDYADKYNYTAYLNSFWHQREVFVEQQKGKGIDDVVFTERIKAHKDFIVFELNENPNIWINRVYARYYGLHSVKMIEK